MTTIETPQDQTMTPETRRALKIAGAGFALLVLAFLPAQVSTHTLTRCLIAWNTGTTLYVLLAVVMTMISRKCLNLQKKKKRLIYRI